MKVDLAAEKLIKANLRWSIFCAATDRKMDTNLDWQSYFEIADSERTFEEKLADYLLIARRRFDVDRFEEFCATHLSHLDEVAHEFFGKPIVHDAIRQKVEALFPEHEVDEFTELFWDRVQNGRDS